MKTLTILIQLTMLKRTLVMFGLLCFIVIGLDMNDAMSEILMGQLNAEDLFVTVLFGVISQAGLLLAIAYFLALFFFLIQLYQENEMYILFTFGISENKLLAWLLPPTILISITVAVLIFFLTPTSAGLMDRIYAAQTQGQLQKITRGKAYFNGKEAVRLTKENLRFIRITEQGALITIGEKDFDISKLIGAFSLRIRNGSWLVWQKDDTDIQGDFQQMEFILRSKYQLSNLLKSRPTQGLWRGNNEELAELYQRIAVFLIVPVTVPLAMVFSRRRPKQKNLLITLGGILCYLMYIHFVIISIDIIRNGGGSLSFWLIQSVVFLLFYILLWARATRFTFSYLSRMR